MAWFCWVLQAERVHAMLHYIRESEKPAFSGDDGSKLLDRGTLVFEAINCLYGTVIVLGVG